MSLDLFLRSNIFLNPGFTTGSAPSAETRAEIVNQVSEVILDEEKFKAVQTGDDSKLNLIAGMNTRHLLAPAIGNFLDKLFLLEPTDTKGFIKPDEQELVDKLVKSRVIPALTDAYRDFSSLGNETGRDYIVQSIKKNNLVDGVKQFYDDALSDFRVVIKEHGDYDSGLDSASIFILGLMGDAHESFGNERKDIDESIEAIKREMDAREADNQGHISFRKLSDDESRETAASELETPMQASDPMVKKFPNDEFRVFTSADMKLLFELGILEDGININSIWSDFDSLESKSIRTFTHYLSSCSLESTDLYGNLDYANPSSRINDLAYIIPKLDSCGLSERGQYIERLASLSVIMLEKAESVTEASRAKLRELLRVIKSKIEATQDSFNNRHSEIIADITQYL